MRHTGNSVHNAYDKMAPKNKEHTSNRVFVHINIIYILTAINTICVGIIFVLWIRLWESFSHQAERQQSFDALLTEQKSGLPKSTLNSSDAHVVRRRSYRNDIRFLEPHQYEKSTGENYCQNIISVCGVHFQGKSGIPGLKGEKGDRGYTGITGSTGSPGKPGQKGEQGEPGIPGLTGLKGEEGLPGLRGPEGPSGGKGERGEIGLQGPKGEKGFQGLVGFPGVTGAKGERGARGQKGEPGESETGQTGVRGEKGEKGMRGLIGFTGYTGDKGERGQKGDLGFGVRGEEGPRGPRGYRGQKGEKGDCSVESIVKMENWRLGNGNSEANYNSGYPIEQSMGSSSGKHRSHPSLILVAVMGLICTKVRILLRLPI